MHVLGTPPAFILSQDQTLMLKFSPGQKSLLAISFPFTVINRFCSLNNSLKNFQGFFSTVQLSRFAVHLSDATLTFYHVRSCLSTTFLTFLKVFCCFLFKNFPPLSQWNYIISPLHQLVNSFLEQKKYLLKRKRRKRDLNPRAGIPDLHP